MPETIDYDALKKRGFLRQKQEGFFLLRVRMACGNFSLACLEKVIEIARVYGRGFVHTTTRQGIEIPFIKFGDIAMVETEIKKAGIETGTSGPRLRTMTSCPGNNWCKSGLVNTSALYERIEKDGIRCAMDLPHKFKIAISGCPNTCTRAQQSEIGIHGQVDIASPDKHIGYAVYLAGCGGKTPRTGFKLDKIFSEDEVLGLIERVVAFFKAHAKPRQRLALLVEEIGKERFLQEVMR
ncbi:MAG: hypothetical protein ABH865_03750 [Candidatus Omnitrophota bacterium]|nr:hypothetical protein [Candidatus Omnitrophota bacterium]